ncbi:hypothetical protein DFH07DRAFT_1028666 [Mycena maculata]|uniref:Uncharacterized protein n=1 Tax=Mycena maculata TaxID=230809 RepID=A0AAD7J2X8_9AGAR|nr:hypothetical protein DFH07DRAFT_1028666 [Mycena maculata]
MPNELLSNTFLLAVTGTISINTPVEKAEFAVGGAWFITQICQQWREITLSIPSLCNTEFMGVCLPRLRRLALYDMSFLDCLETPVLEELVVFELPAPVLSLLHRSCPPKRLVSLGCSDPTQIVPITMTSICIQTYKVVQVHGVLALHDLFSRLAGDDTAFAPNLEIISLQLDFGSKLASENLFLEWWNPDGVRESYADAETLWFPADLAFSDVDDADYADFEQNDTGGKSQLTQDSPVFHSCGLGVTKDTQRIDKGQTKGRTGFPDATVTWALFGCQPPPDHMSEMQVNPGTQNPPTLSMRMEMQDNMRNSKSLRLRRTSAVSLLKLGNRPAFCETPLPNAAILRICRAVSPV